MRKIPHQEITGNGTFCLLFHHNRNSWKSSVLQTIRQKLWSTQNRKKLKFLLELDCSSFFMRVSEQKQLVLVLIQNVTFD
jgi:hypothetical protein